MATRKQLAALKKARAARKRNLAAKKRKKIIPKSKPKKRRRKSPAKRAVIRSPKPKAKRARKRRVKRNPSGGKEYFVYTMKGRTKYWLQKIGGEWQFHSTKPNGMSEKMKDDAIRIAKRFLKRLPAGHHIYMDIQKKRA